MSLKSDSAGSENPLDAILGELRGSEILGESRMLAAVVGEDGLIHGWNRACEELTGLDFKDVGQQPFWEVFFHAEEREHVRETFTKGLCDTPGKQCQSYSRAASGEHLHILWSHSRISGLPERTCLITGVDITDCVEALRQAQQRAEFVLDATSDGIWDYDLTAHSCFFRSDRCREILGIEAGEVPVDESQWLEIVHPDDRALVLHRLREHLDGKTDRLESEFRLRHEDGHWTWIQNRARVVSRTAEGAPLRMVGAITDITKQKTAEATSQEDRWARRGIVEASPLAVVQIDGAGTVLSWNPAAEKIFGWSEKEVLGKRLPIIPEGEWSSLAGLARRLELPPGPERKRLRKDGSTIDVACWVACVGDIRDGSSGLIIEYADLTERKLLEDHVRRTQKMQAIGKLAGGIAHDFNNLLTTMVGYTSLVAASPSIADKQRTQLQQVLEAGERATALARQLLTFSRRTPMRLEPCDLNDVVRQSAAMLSRVIGEDIEIRLELAGRLPSIQADRVQLDQVIVNLAINSRDAMPSGGRLVLRTYGEEVNEARAAHLGLRPGPHAVLAVTDNGAGMTPEVQAHIFEPFFTTKRAGEGTGLGLSTVYGTVSQLNGAIQVQSALGSGSTFTIHLPAQHASVATPPTEAEKDKDVGHSEIVLLVEDDPGVRAYVSDLLESHGYRVAGFASPVDALAWAQAGAGFDLLLSDVVMPGMNGVEMLARMRELRPDVRVVFMSGYPDRLQELSDLIPSGSLLAKPFTPASLLAALRRALEAR